MEATIICYHSEQSAEGALKSFLVFHDVELSRSYDIEMLCRNFMDIDMTFDELVMPCRSLASAIAQDENE